MGGRLIGYINKNDTWKSIDGGQTWSLVLADGEWPARERHTSVVFKN